MDPQAFDTDALSMDWDILPFPYLFPPSPILPVVLQKVKQSDNTFLVIAPLWPHQSWYPDLISLSVDHPLCLPQREDLLVHDLPKRFWIHPNPGLCQYHAWLLSGSTSKQQVFRWALRTELPCLRETPQDASTMPSGKSICSRERPHCLSILLGGIARRCHPHSITWWTWLTEFSWGISSKTWICNAPSTRNFALNGTLP